MGTSQDTTNILGRPNAPPASITSNSITSNTEAETLVGTPQRVQSRERDDVLNENSPLLSPTTSIHPDEDEGLMDEHTVLDDQDDYQATKSTGYLILLTLAIGGLQVAWSTELSNGSPYLLSLGISKSLMALVWIAGPMSGSLVQPYVGMLSDSCRLKWGKRKPYMIGGTIATILALGGLAWAREIVNAITSILGADPGSNTVKNIIIVWAVSFVYLLDFAINTVQAGIRAFMVDCAPTHQQDATNAMASRILGIGNILGYVFGYLKLPKIFPFLGNTQFQVLCALAAISLGSTVAISTSCITERDPRLEGPPPNKKGGLLSFFRALFKSIRTLPPDTKKVCQVQFFSWVGWFGFLFYCTTWIGELWVQPYFTENPNMTMEEINAIYEKSTRVGTFALLVWAITSLIANVFLPFIVAPTHQPSTPAPSNHSMHSSKSYTTRVDRFLDALVIPWLTLQRAWMISIVIFAVSLFSTFFITSPTTATVVVGVIGIPWAMSLWAPFAIIAAEVSKRDALRRSKATQSTPSHHNSFTTDDESNQRQDNGDQAGVILGIHNMSIASPQVFATLISSLIFKLLQKPRGKPGDRSLPAVFGVFAIFVVFSAVLAARLDVKNASQEGTSDDIGTDSSRRRRGRGRMVPGLGGGGH